MKKHLIIPFFIPHMGCRNACVFCNQKSITGQVNNIDPSYMEKTIASFKLEGREIVEVAFFGGSFTGLDLTYQEDLLKVVKRYKDEGLINRIRLSTRPDYIDRVILNFLKEYSVDLIELGAQSMAKDVLDMSKRGHRVEDVKKASKLIIDEGFDLGLQMMLGLPNDTYEKDIMTAKEFASLKPACVRIYPSLVIKDTEMEKLYKEGSYSPLDLDETISILKDILIFFKYKDIDVIRVGLQTTESLINDLVAGPYHPSIREMAESLIYREFLERFLRDRNIIGSKLLVELPRADIPSASGYKRANKDYFKEKYKINLAFKEGLDCRVFYGDDTYRLDIDKYIREYLQEKGII